MTTSSSPLAQRGLKPAAVLAANKPHGVRLRYMGGCRCFHCRRANSAYEAARKKARLAGDANGIVSADRAREHILRLSKQGIGRRAVAAASDVALSIIHQIRTGRRTRIRQQTERRVLAVTTRCRSDSSFVSAKRTWRLIGILLEEGFTKARLAAELGYRARALQFGKSRVTARIDQRVAAMFRRLTT